VAVGLNSLAVRERTARSSMRQLTQVRSGETVIAAFMVGVHGTWDVGLGERK
jgi:hypothetical protein